MIITRIKVQISQKLYVGGYETLEPCIALEADLDPGEDLEHARSIVASKCQELWLQEAREELRLVSSRRALSVPPDNKLPELTYSLDNINKGNET